MLIKKTRIRQLSLYLGGLIPQTAFLVVVDTSQVSVMKLNRSGFSSLVPGDTLLPAAIGPISRTNAEGGYIVHREQPKESRHVGRREWTRQEWAGRGHTNTVTNEVDIYRDCYPRTFVSPPSVELTVVDHESGRFIVAPEMTWSGSASGDILHVINLFLELFGEVEIRHQDLSTFTPPNTKRVNWSLLPSGPKPFETVIGHVQPIIDRRAPSFRGPIMSRLRYLASLNPDEVYLGHGGFSAYVAYLFHSTGKAVLESVLPENATYVFGGDWQVVSKLTKAQVLSHSLQIERIFHSEGWPEKVAAHAR